MLFLIVDLYVIRPNVLMDSANAERLEHMTRLCSHSTAGNGQPYAAAKATITLKQALSFRRLLLMSVPFD